MQDHHIKTSPKKLNKWEKTIFTRQLFETIPTQKKIKNLGSMNLFFQYVERHYRDLYDISMLGFLLLCLEIVLL